MRLGGGELPADGEKIRGGYIRRMTRPGGAISAVLFDLDGTLVDTAPDLAFALNELRREYGLCALAFDHIRPHVSHGSIALMRCGFDLSEDSAEFEVRRQRLLDIYRANIARHSRLFPGMLAVLDHLEQRQIAWGIVTNKPGWLTDPLLAALNLNTRLQALVSGDTLTVRKPDPAPLLLAAEQMGVTAARCVYIGDAIRDIEAGRNAKITTLVALYGYIGEDETPESWGADGQVHDPLEIIDWLEQHGK